MLYLDYVKAYDERYMAMPFGDIVAEKSKSVYINFEATGAYSVSLGKALYFRPDPELDCDKSIIKGIQLISAQEQSSNSYNNQGKDNLNVNDLRQGILYISNNSREIIATLPFHNLIKFANDGKLTMTYFTQHIWQNCFVEFVGVSGINSTKGLHFIIYYDTI